MKNRVRQNKIEFYNRSSVHPGDFMMAPAPRLAFLLRSQVILEGKHILQEDQEIFGKVLYIYINCPLRVRLLTPL